MKKYNRIFVIVLDSLGIGAMPDSERFGDTDVDTFGHILERMQTLDIPNLTRLGMLNLHCGGQMQPAAEPIGRFTRLAEASNGKGQRAYGDIFSVSNGETNMSVGKQNKKCTPVR
jgi:phosphopentomutase